MGSEKDLTEEQKGAIVYGYCKNDSYCTIAANVGYRKSVVDESTFCLFQQSSCRVWRESHEEWDIECVSSTVKHGPSQMHWDFFLGMELALSSRSMALPLVSLTLKFFVASRIGWAVLQNNKNSAQTVKIFEDVYSDPDISLSYPKILITDKGTEFLGECKKFYDKQNIEHIQALTKEGVGIIERFNCTLIEKVFPIQYAQEMLLAWPERSRVFKKILRPILIKLNNTPTRLIGMSPADARKKKHVYAKPSKPRNGLIGYDEPRLSYRDFVRYLLKPGELEGGLPRR
ncbi:4916_t:CDS:2 [Ambispora gerdemannii]|uniref:4916_t:CDS:1 n=1 Tax=Ambispora gerdemannii TaxID=144530 RepID=A0A9N8YXJ5_9GLOM|nr:4916_t:CDS:2 [Ambispora gerdemannii]